MTKSRFNIAPKPETWNEGAPWGTCKWCAKPILKDDGTVNTRRRWHPECSRAWNLENNPNAQRAHVRNRSGDMCENCGAETWVIFARVWEFHGEKRGKGKRERRFSIVTMGPDWRVSGDSFLLPLGEVRRSVRLVEVGVGWHEKARACRLPVILGPAQYYSGYFMISTPEGTRRATIGGPFCEVEPVYLGTADHKVPLWKVRAMNIAPAAERKYHGPGNLQHLCPACENAKTHKREAPERARLKRRNARAMGKKPRKKLQGRGFEKGPFKRKVDGTTVER